MTPSIDPSRRSTLVVLSGGNFAQFGTRIIIGALVPFILLDFENATKSGIGLALTGMWAVYALFQFPSGILADQYGERLLLLAGLAGSALGAVLLAFAPSLLVFSVFATVLGAGTGVFYPPASVLLSRLYDDHGGPIGILAALGTFAGLVYPAVGSAASIELGWRTVIALTAVIPLTVLVGTVLFVPRRAPMNPSESLRSSLDVARYRKLLARPSLLYSMAIAVAVIFTFQAVASFFPTFLVEYHGLDRGLAGTILGLVLGISTVAQPVAGRLSDRFSRDSIIGASLAFIILAMLVLLFSPSDIGPFVGSALLGVGISWPGPLQSLILDNLAESERGYGFGLIRTVYMGLGASGSVVVGTLADVSGWFAGFGLVAVLLTTCLLLLGTNRAFSLGL